MNAITDNMIIDCILEDGPEDAIILLISIYPNEITNAYTIYNRWKRIRSLIMRDDRFINSNYEDSIQELMTTSKLLDPSYFDFQLLKNLLLSSQVDRHNIQKNTRSNIFKSRRTYDLFKTIRPLIDSFYDFVLPADIIEANDLVVQNTNVQKQTHVKSRSNIFEISTTQLFKYKRAALDVLHDIDSLTKANIGYAICAIQILCGRRLIEVLSGMEFHGMGPTRFSARVSHLAKEKASLGEKNDDILVIPLLCEYSAFESTIKKIRSIEPTSGAVRTYVITKTSKASKEMFGRILDHTIKRSIYCELCWIQKNEHKCYLGYSKKMFCGTILGHSLTNFDATDQYTNITVV